ncbi:hypothetical protein ACFP1Z_18315 [Streptomyces gamaensis]|uniref:Lipoprotein n=1 Tax=Streptomyces gamaensis TaxID=1763542 RepID=A0ABW0Z2Z8_9ACTN
MSQHSQPKRRNWFARHKVLTGAGALVAVIAVGTAVGGGGEESGATAKSADHAGKAADAGADKSKGKPKADMSGNGTFRVGSDIKPGTYRSVGNKAGCYWERAKDATGDMDAVLANDNVVGTTYVTVADSDKVFKTSSCKSWELVKADAPADTAPKAQLSGNGMYKVGVDIAPGTYRAEGNKSGCYWERDKNALHESDSVEANDNVTGSAVVTVTSQDAYFKTQGCADWKKTG